MPASIIDRFKKFLSARLDLLIVILLVLAVSAVAALYLGGVFYLNNPNPIIFPVMGVDVSAHQGNIDWETIAAQDVDFAYIKATEGAGFTDKQFSANFAGSAAAGIRPGAYHFFSYDSAGVAQAEHFISVVPKTEGMLPPAVDIEFYGDYDSHPLDAIAVRAELTSMLTELESYYGVRPVIYATERSYSLYIDGFFDDYDLWLRNIYTGPASDRWTFWQYADKGRLNGTDGHESFIDLNVFNGNDNAFIAYGLPGD